VSDLLRISRVHDIVKRRLLVGDGANRFAEHIASCPTCGVLAAKLAAIEALLMEAPAPRLGLLDDILEATTDRAYEDSARDAGRRMCLREGGARIPVGVGVLLVEDDPSVAAMYQTRLEMDGCRVVVTDDGDTALRLVRELAPKLVVLEYGLQQGRRGSLLRALRADARTRDQAVVVLSSLDEASLIAESRSLGVLAWLVKAQTLPADLSVLVQRLVGLTVFRGEHRTP
jgi:CheY-like chemotaxis protein